jgi:hypothetical protein
MPCICGGTFFVNKCADFETNDCLLGICVYKYEGGVFRFVRHAVTDDTCFIEGDPICAPQLSRCSRSVTDAEEYHTLVTRQQYYLVDGNKVVSGTIDKDGSLHCYSGSDQSNQCVTRCLKDGSVYYIDTANSCRGSDYCYCEHELSVCGPTVNSRQPEMTGQCRIGFPLRRQCRDAFCQYICDREGSNVYKFRLVTPCPEGCMCKPLFIYNEYRNIGSGYMCGYHYYFGYDNRMYDGECCPATYGSTITIACLDSNDPIINCTCPVDVETCQMEIVDFIDNYNIRPQRRLKVIIHDKCHMERVNYAFFNVDECDYHDSITLINLPCVCSLLASIHNHWTCGEEPFHRDGGQIVVYVNCEDIRLWSSPCHVCNAPPGTIIEALCAFNELHRNI